MIVTDSSDIVGTPRDVTAENGTWSSLRLVVANDNVGFSLHDTTVAAGTTNRFHYAHHIEAVLIIDGIGAVTDLRTGDEHALSPGVLYLLNDHDEHILHAETQIRAICVFNPATSGTERHDATGAYPALN
ncbi:ectoine synthase [Gordonia sp. N1V]|uniref:ectoine synthase n=1 Tax=Gordonia sp. N1V TaxID=3034163 RepID=UPI0023E09765|nr:ectoine synthase [Gordonia sp. N1V]MDF3285487.1 ectoine synthase [Gordonia sp. N1V]